MRSAAKEHFSFRFWYQQSGQDTAAQSWTPRHYLGVIAFFELPSQTHGGPPGKSPLCSLSLYLSLSLTPSLEFFFFHPVVSGVFYICVVLLQRYVKEDSTNKPWLSGWNSL